MSSRGVKYYVDRQIIGKTVVSNTAPKNGAATIEELMATPYRTFERKGKDGNGYRPEIAPNTAAKEELHTSHTYMKKDHANINKFHEDLQMIRKRKAEAITYDDSSSSDDDICRSQDRPTKKRSFDDSSCSEDIPSHCQARLAIKRRKLWDHPMFKPQSERLASAAALKAESPKIKIKISTKTKPKLGSSKIKLVIKQARLEEAIKAQQTLDCASRLREHARWNDCIAEPSPEYLECQRRKDKNREEAEGDDKTEKWCPWDNYGELWQKKIADKIAASTSHTVFWQERNKGCEQSWTAPIVASQSYRRCINNEILNPGIDPEKIKKVQARFRASLHEKCPRNSQKDATKIFRKAHKIAQIASKYVEEKANTTNLIRKAEADIAMAEKEGVSAAVISVCIKPISAIPMRVRHLHLKCLPRAEKFIS